MWEHSLVALTLGVFVVGCGDDGKGGNYTNATTRATAGDGMIGAVDLAVRPAPSAQGIEPGTGAGAIIDGWTVQYTKFVVVIGGFQAETLRDPGEHVVDLLAEPTGAVIARLRDVPVGPYGSLGFTWPVAGQASEPPGPDRDRMLNVYSIYFEGRIAKKDGQSCRPSDPTDCVAADEIRFRWGFDAPAAATECAGFEVMVDETTEITLEIPGDRWFDTTFDPDDGSPLRAQWIADADRDHDGETTLDELQGLRALDAFRPELGYDLASAASPIDLASEYVESQIRTLGRDSWGACRTTPP